jgi:stage V sporulation protein D (sporulation-specific penicillin-binding protein)
VLIVIDEPQGYAHGGGAIAAPVAGRVIEETLKYLNIDPVYSAKELAQLNGITPDVNSMTIDKAKATLQNKGFKARVVGDGKTVLSQYPLKGQNIPLDGVVILYTEKETSNSTSTVPDLRGLSISSANERAVNAGFNIKISGASLDSEVISYRQSIDAGTQAELGATITVYFKTNKGVED